jgi:RHS repeat-associated protein
VTWFAYSGWQVLAEYEDSGALDAFQPSRKFVYGAYVDEPLLMLSCSELAGGGRTETAYYYHQDRNFNVIALTDDTGQVVDRYSYSAYGEIETLTNGGTKITSNPYFFTGRRFDAELRIYYYRARYHDPALGRFLSRDSGAGAGDPDRMGDGGAPAATGRFIPRDPTGSNQYADGMNLYQYVRSNPVRYMDPQGTNIYLKKGNPGAGSVNNALHQKVCVDTWDKKGCKTGEACFSFGKTGWMFRFGPRLRWLGWKSYVLGGILMKGEIYQDLTAGTVVKTKKTTVAQDKAWLKRMQRRRLTEDVYSVGRHNCRTYSQWEFRDAP